MPDFGSQYSYARSKETVFKGMEDAQYRLGLIVKNNIKNANTVGFKAVFSNSVLLDPYNADKFRDESQGVNMKTPNNPLNLAIDGNNAFFLVEGPNGPERTRDGRFMLNEDGEIVNHEGKELVILNRPTDLDTRDLIKHSEDIVINRFGEIRVKGQFLGKIALDYHNRMPGQQASVQQGYLEMSNVSLEDSIMKVVELKRHHETLQNMMAMNMTVEKSLVDTYGRNV